MGKIWMVLMLASAGVSLVCGRGGEAAEALLSSGSQAVELLLTLLAVGLTMLYSASYAQSQYDTGYTVSTRYLQKQGVCALIGLVAMYFFSRIPADSNSLALSLVRK